MGDRSDKYVDVSVTPTLTAGAYAQYDVAGSLMTFQFGGSANGLLLTGFKLTDKGAKANALRIYIFDALPDTAAIADNAAMAIAAADLPMLLYDFTIATGDYLTYSSLDWYYKFFSPAIALELGANAAIYMYAVLTAASPTNPGSTTDLTFTLRALTQR